MCDLSECNLLLLGLGSLRSGYGRSYYHRPSDRFGDFAENSSTGSGAVDVTVIHGYGKFTDKIDGCVLVLSSHNSV